MDMVPDILWGLGVRSLPHSETCTRVHEIKQMFHGSGHLQRQLPPEQSLDGWHLQPKTATWSLQGWESGVEGEDTQEVSSGLFTSQTPSTSAAGDWSPLGSQPSASSQLQSMTSHGTLETSPDDRNYTMGTGKPQSTFGAVSSGKLV